MPLDTSTYALALLRPDGRRWNELRRLHGAISTQAAADGSAYFELGHTKVICTVSGPAELRRGAAGGGGGGAGERGGGGGGGGDDRERATVVVEVDVAGFSGVDRRKRSRTDKRTQELQHTIASAFSSVLFTHLYPRSTIAVSLHVLAQDGGVLAACLNAATLALVDAGIPSADLLVACSAGTTAGVVGGLHGSGDSDDSDAADPLLDLSATEEQELPFLTAATLGASDQVVVLVCETRVAVPRIEGMLAVAVDGCKQVRDILDGVIRRQGQRTLEKDGT